MKICNQCNHAESDSAVFCSNCSGTDFLIVKEIDEDVREQYRQSLYYNTNIELTPEQIKRKKIMSLIGVIILLLLGLFVFMMVRISLEAKEEIRNNAEDNSFGHYMPYSPETLQH